MPGLRTRSQLASRLRNTHSTAVEGTLNSAPRDDHDAMGQADPDIATEMEVDPDLPQEDAQGHEQTQGTLGEPYIHENYHGMLSNIYS